MDSSILLPRRPYLLRAFYDWILDNELTPYILVDATYYGVDVPNEFVSDGKIVLNIAPQSVDMFNMNSESVQFTARFSSVPHQIFIPLGAIEAIYARENGAGIAFEPEPQYENPSEKSVESLTKSMSKKTDKPKSSIFKVVK